MRRHRIWSDPGIVFVLLLATACQELPSEPAAIDLSRDRPIALDDIVSTPEETSVLVDVLENDSSLVGATLVVKDLVTQPVHGSAEIEDNMVRYEPEADYNGADSLTYRVDGGILSATARITISVTPVNDAPDAVNDTVQVDETEALAKGFAELDVLANDRDIDGDQLRIQKVTLPERGGVEIIGDGDRIVYDPTPDFSGSDRFTYTVTDGNGGLDIADVFITVLPTNDLPRANNDSYATEEDTPLEVAGPGVLGNDSDPDEEELRSELISGPVNGDLTLNDDGSFRYVPNPDFSGGDQFEYRAVDPAGESDTAMAMISVASVNDPPLALDDAYQTRWGETLTVDPPGVLANDTDIDGDDLRAALEVASRHGEVILNDNGSFTYTAVVGFSGPDSFLYVASDGIATTVATVRIDVGVGNRAPVVEPDSFFVDENRLLSVQAPGVLSNDSDPDGDEMTAILTADVSDGVLRLESNGSFTFTPNLDFAGTDSFSYLATDGRLSSDPTSVTIVVRRVNEAPEVLPDTFFVRADSVLDVPAPGVLSNDLDADGDELEARLIFGVERGMLDLRSDGSFRYDPDDDFAGIDRFGYFATDGQASSATAIVEIRVAAAAKPPIAVDDAYQVAVNDTLTVVAPGVLENDIDPDGGALRAELINPPTSGILELQEDGSFVFIPELDFEGTAEFTYRARDESEISNPAVVTIDVVP